MTAQAIEIGYDDEVEVYAEDRVPFTQVGDWILLADIPQQAKTLYWALAAHINVTADAGHPAPWTIPKKVWPTRDTLAGFLGMSRGDKIKPYLDALEELGALRIVVTRNPDNPMRQRSTYWVRQQPPPGYAGLRSLTDFYAARRTDQG